MYQPHTHASTRSLGLLLLQLLLIGCVSSGSWPTASKLEKTFRVSGYVLDAVSREPVPNIVVQGGYELARTETNGHFVFRFPIRYRKEAGRVWVQTMLYNGQADTPADTAQVVTLLLKRNAYRFKPQDCQQAADSVHLSPYASPLLGIPGEQMAFLLRDSTARHPQKLRALTFRFGQEGFPRESFRVRLYRCDGPELPPGQDLLPENVILEDYGEAVRTVNLSAYNIAIPPAGFFVALEAIVREFKRRPVDEYLPTGPALRPPCAFASTRTWTYTYGMGQGWHRVTPANNCWPLYERAFSAEIESGPSQPEKH